MEKDQNTNSEAKENEAEEVKTEDLNNNSQSDSSESDELPKEVTPEEKILELEDKLARAFAEMENQRRRFEKENKEAEETKSDELNDVAKNIAPENNEEIKEVTPEEKILELEEKLTRTFAEMENQRRRFEKEKEDAFEFGGFAFAKECITIIDNLERAKISLSLIHI